MVARSSSSHQKEGSDFNNLGLVDRCVMGYWDMCLICVSTALLPSVFFLVSFLHADTSANGIYSIISNCYEVGYCGG